MDEQLFIHIGFDSPNADFIRINILRRAHPDATDCWDGNWISTEIELVVGAFKGNFRADLRCDELERFNTQLARLYESAEGTASFETMEGQLSLTLNRDRNGHVRVLGKAMDQAGIGNSVHWRFEIDQSFLPPIMRQLESVLTRFPVIARP